jgi:hypothetical protein
MKTKNFLVIVLLFFFFGNNQIQAQTTVGSSQFNNLKNQLGTQRGGDEGGESTPVGGTVSGGADKPIGLISNVPGITLIVQKPATVKWKGIQSLPPYTISIMSNDGNGKVLYQATTSQKEWTIPFDKLALKEETSYMLEISDGSPTTWYSAPSVFKLVSQEFYDKTLTNLRDTPHFQNSSRSDKIVMKAMQLQMNDLNYDANSLYESQISADDYDVFLLNMRDQFKKSMKSKTDF